MLRPVSFTNHWFTKRFAGVPVNEHIPPSNVAKDSGIKILAGAISSFAQTDNATGNNSASAPILFMNTDKDAPTTHRNKSITVSFCVRAEICAAKLSMICVRASAATTSRISTTVMTAGLERSEEHTSELQSREN